MVLSEKNKNIVNLLEHFHTLFKVKSVLNINMVENPYSSFNYHQKKDFNNLNFSTLLDEVRFEQTLIKARFIPQEIHNFVNSNLKYDMLIAQFPLNVKNSSLEEFCTTEGSLEVFKNFNTNFENIALFETIKLLKKDGFCFFFSSSSILNNQKKFIKLIEKKGFFLNGIINVKNIYPFTNIDIYLCIFSFKQSKNLFAGELSEFNSKALINNFYLSFINNNSTSLSSSDIYSGVLTSLDECYNLETLKHQFELRSVFKAL